MSQVSVGGGGEDVIVLRVDWLFGLGVRHWWRESDGCWSSLLGLGRVA